MLHPTPAQPKEVEGPGRAECSQGHLLFGIGWEKSYAIIFLRLKFTCRHTAEHILVPLGVHRNREDNVRMDKLT
jgi:hypothetical protein